jgi:hypothetical protein
MPRDIGRTTVDHYIPKSIAPNLAYEWTNYRLAAGLYNSRKRDFLDVLDPFQIGYRWFILDIPSLQVKPNPKLNPSESRLVQATINRLKLNDETSIRGRRNWLNPLIQGKITFDYLRERAPFLAQELEVSALTAAATLRTVFKFPEYLTAQAPSTNGQPHST